FNNPPSQNISPQGFEQTPPPSVGKGLIWALSIVIVILLATIFYLAYAQYFKSALVEEESESQKKTESEEQFAVPSDWKTYSNERYGFEFEYPVSHTLADYNVPRTIGVLAESNYIALTNSNKNVSDPEPISFIVVEGISQSLKEFAEYAYEHTKTEGNPPALLGPLESTAIAGGKGYIFTCNGMCSVAPHYGFFRSDTPKKILFLRKQDDVIFAVYMSEDELYKQILSTFKFTE
ncbi:MAG: hypothetical protein Q8P86_02240, partial [bacterium]|nr:hypothetical protein [bacterium]